MIQRILVGLILVAGAWGVAGAAASRRKAAEPASEASSVDRQRFELYLKERLDKIKAHHKDRMDFFASETETWNTFWSKVRDDRQQFEVRITRQTLDLFESLASLDSEAHGSAISDFEKLQGNVTRSFETQQRQKMQEFFAKRDQRWREFAFAQERERNEFLTEAQSGWEGHKASLHGGTPAPRPKAKAQVKPEEDEEIEERPERKMRVRNKSSALGGL